MGSERRTWKVIIILKWTTLTTRFISLLSDTSTFCDSTALKLIEFDTWCILLWKYCPSTHCLVLICVSVPWVTVLSSWSSSFCIHCFWYSSCSREPVKDEWGLSVFGVLLQNVHPWGLGWSRSLLRARGTEVADPALILPPEVTGSASAQMSTLSCQEVERQDLTKCLAEQECLGQCEPSHLHACLATHNS